MYFFRIQLIRVLKFDIKDFFILYLNIFYINLVYKLQVLGPISDTYTVHHLVDYITLLQTFGPISETYTACRDIECDPILFSKGKNLEKI